MTSCRLIFFALIGLTITPMATAQIYKCDGPDGPVFSDEKCGSDATIVEVEATSGLGGISDETKDELASKKAEREQARNDNNKGASNNIQNSTVITQPAEQLEEGEWINGQWVRRPVQLPIRPGSPGLKPVQLPAPKTGGKRRN